MIKYADITLEELYYNSSFLNKEYICDGDKKVVKESD